MFRFFFTLLIVVAFAGLLYLVTRVHRFFSLAQPAWRKKALWWLVSCLPVLALLWYCIRHTVVGVIVVIHLIVFWLLSDLLGRLMRRFVLKTKGKRIYFEGVLAILVTVIYLSIGWVLAHHVVETDYELSTQKDLGVPSLRIVQISDSHVGSTFDGEGFARHMQTVARTHPDLVVITGDYVDDDTTREDMIRCCQALGELETTYGVYFVFGNHDKGYFQYRSFTQQDLREELARNHVTILEDEKVMLTDQVCLIGRQDRSTPGRLSMAVLTEDVEESWYTIVLDHQPHDFAAQAEAGVDLVLCGHTHGGQMFPIGWTGEVSGANDKTYGLEVRDHTTFIVNSGISDWAIPFKTGTIAEFGVIDVRVS